MNCLQPAVKATIIHCCHQLLWTGH
jgi:hypothetical protein